MGNRRAPARRRRIECWWQNPPTELRVLLHITTNGHRVERKVGPRGRLDLAEATAVLRVPARAIRRAIDRGDLHARWTHGQPFVTLQDAVQWWEREENGFDQKAADQARRDMEAAGERPIPWEQARQRL
jgi:hypothetical protein